MIGTFVSIWDCNTKICTQAELIIDTGEILTKSIDINNVNFLEREYFESEDGEIFEVCPECHEYILKTVMKESIGKTLYEIQVCSNPDCINQ